MSTVRPRSFAAIAMTMLAFVPLAGQAAGPSELRMNVGAWRIVEREPGLVNYCSVFKDATPPYIHAAYHPPMKTAVLGFQLPDADRSRGKQLRWSWRAITLPSGGNECADGKGDSAAVVYVT